MNGEQPAQQHRRFWRDIARRARGFISPAELVRLVAPTTPIASVLRYVSRQGEAHLDTDDLDARDPEFVRWVMDMARWFGQHYFRLRFEGLENLPAEGPGLIVGNHNGGIMPLDGFFTVLGVWDHLGPSRAVHPLVHDLIAQNPLAYRLAVAGGALRATQGGGEKALRAGDLALAYPGSDRETFRPFWQRHRIDLGGRMGFLRLAIREGAPIVPAVSVGTHEQLIVLSRGDRLARLLRTDKWLRTRVIPIVLCVPWGLTIGLLPYVPLPAQTTIAFGAPLRWPELHPADADDPAVLTRCYDDVVRVMQQMLDRLSEGRRPWLGKP
jgi:1-acyl-sn-glycerol-3-phosphate acyltransferase